MFNRLEEKQKRMAKKFFAILLAMLMVMQIPLNYVFADSVERVTKGDNPDNLTEAEINATPFKVFINKKIYPETNFVVETSGLKRSNSSMRANDPPIIGVDHPENPGDVMLFKEAKPVEGMVNTYDITLRMEAKDSIKTSDIILVMDRSGSMAPYQGNNYTDRMAAAKEAANLFVDTLLPSPTTRIGVVSFAGGVTTNQALTANKTNLHNAINGLNANGGTFTQAGIKQAEAILENSNADFKHIVLLSDGVPTYSYRLQNPNDYYSANVNPNINIPQSQFMYPIRVGTGYGMLYGRYNHGNNTIAEAGYAKDSGYSSWTIALQAGSTGNQVLNAVASPGQAYTADPDDLNAIFGEIAGKISSAMQDA